MRQKQIYINGRFLTHSITGVQRYAMELIKAFDRLIGEEDRAFVGFTFTLLAPHGKLAELELKHIAIKQVGPLSGHLWEQTVLPLHASNGFLINLCNTAPLLKRNQSVTIHDAAVFAVPDTYSFSFRTFYKLLCTSLGVTAKQIITCSQFSKEQLQQYYKIKGHKIEAIYHGKEHVLEQEAAPGYIAKKQLDRPYILAVSSMSPNKNFKSIVEAIEMINEPDFDFVIAGGASKIFNSSQASLSGNVKHLGYVEEDELRALYDNASCFVFPSFYEGFGLPPLEAMACGCPVIASSAASIPEVCGNAALYCDPHSARDIADKIQMLMGNKELRQHLSKLGKERSQLFTWNHSARETMKVIRQTLNVSGAMTEHSTAGALSRK